MGRSVPAASPQAPSSMAAYAMARGITQQRTAEPSLVDNGSTTLCRWAPARGGEAAAHRQQLVVAGWSNCLGHISAFAGPPADVAGWRSSRAFPPGLHG